MIPDERTVRRIYGTAHTDKRLSNLPPFLERASPQTPSREWLGRPATRDLTFQGPWGEKMAGERVRLPPSGFFKVPAALIVRTSRSVSKMRLSNPLTPAALSANDVFLERYLSYHYDPTNYLLSPHMNSHGNGERERESLGVAPCRVGNC